MDGLELIQRIRKKYDFIACVVLSGYDDFTYAREAIKNQAVDYLLKPRKDKIVSRLIKTYVSLLSIPTFSHISPNLPIIGK